MKEEGGGVVRGSVGDRGTFMGHQELMGGGELYETSQQSRPWLILLALLGIFICILIA